MAYITKDKVKDIIQNHPNKEIHPAQIVAQLRQRGHQLEGYNESVDRVNEKKYGKKGISGVFEGLKKSAIGTFRGMSSFGEKGLEAGLKTILPKSLEPKFGLTDDEKMTGAEQLIPEQETVGSSERIGSFLGDVATFLLPSAAGIKAGKVAGAAIKGGRLAKGAAALGAGAGVEGLASGATEFVREGGELSPEVKVSAIAGTLAPGVALGVKGGAKIAGKLFANASKKLAGAATGKGSEVIEQIYRNPTAAKKGLRGDSVQVLKETTEEVRKAVKGLRSEASKAYGNAIDNLPKIVGDSVDVLKNTDKAIVKSGDKIIELTRSDVRDKLASQLGKFGVELTDDVGVKIKSAPFVDSEEKILNKVVDKINKWDDLSPEGLNKLAVSVGKFRKRGAQSKELNSIIDATKKGIREYIGDKFPQIKELNKNYFERMDFIQALESELSIGTGAKSVSTEQLIKQARKISTMFNSNKALTVDLVKQLERKMDIQVIGVEAGRQLAEGQLTRASSSIGDFVKDIVQAIIPAKGVGEAAAFTGDVAKIVGPKAKEFSQFINKLQPGPRSAMIQFLRSTLDGLE